MSTHNLCFEQKYEKISEFLVWKFSVFGGEIFNIFEYVCFRNGIDFQWHQEEKQTNHNSQCIKL